MKSIVKISSCFFLSILSIFQIGYAQETNTFLSAHIDFQPNGELTVIKSFCKNHTEAPLLLRFELELEHTGKKGKSTQEEGTTFDIRPRQDYLLSLNTINYGPKDILTAVLKIFSAEELVAADTLQIKPQSKAPPPEILQLTEEILKKKREPSVSEQIATATKNNPPVATAPSPAVAPKTKSPQQQQKQQPSAPPPPTKARDRVIAPQEDIGIDGLIIDETRTKMAHDFYDLFYRKWIAPPGVADFIIYVRELPSRGRIARVALSVNDEVVLQRNLSPRFELLEEQVNLAIRVLTNHLRRKESVKQQLGQEDTSGSGIF